MKRRNLFAASALTVAFRPDSSITTQLWAGPLPVVSRETASNWPWPAGALAVVPKLSLADPPLKRLSVQSQERSRQLSRSVTHTVFHRVIHRPARIEGPHWGATPFGFEVLKVPANMLCGPKSHHKKSTAYQLYPWRYVGLATELPSAYDWHCMQAAITHHLSEVRTARSVAPFPAWNHKLQGY